ncbi:(R,R)-butanediol dehydrogenase / meso-butanediol dehydrogenase / diacetyl reductase/L-iditol 2-dehydrogenase/hypothetical protein [Desulfocicer vacuolatum DSM 3385]|uniref:Enoyl reductase (ER) domain-containing protein n=1 Tax=Desulfocicer vacuolatum DSM 3385 TaxID=1121400 RepID=A0A1W2D574_9BACT|nr:zinc-binding dehydrogenase [Desulfocicer vacuolatum]SMC92591.1 (R,R)-butanediol dehydrogenase / meso-butanediol dehydrogenase / diacetyl reductase/L-iditol 2-dehydrogenase/hypothetical protein [Desulfocicer vacuolatum DSM 3385]
MNESIKNIDKRSQEDDMTFMKGAVFYGNRDMRVIDMPKAAAGQDGVLIQVKTVGICGTDLHTYKTGMFKEMSIPADNGVLFGHEFAGNVEEIGADAHLEGIQIGDRVTGITFGAYAEYCRCGPELLGAPLVFKLPDHVSYEEAATTEPLAVSLSAVRRADPKPGEKALIIGAGMIGLGCIQVLKALCPQCEIIVSDLSEKRLKMAKTFGADRTINVANEDVVAVMKGEGEESVLYNAKSSAQVDMVFECAGLEITLNQALEITKPQTGRLVCVALYEKACKVDVNQLVTKNIDIHGLFAYTPDDIKDAIDLMASEKVDRKPLITHRFPLADIKDAFETQIKVSESLKAVVNF